MLLKILISLIVGLFVIDVAATIYFYNIASIRDPKATVGQLSKSSKNYPLVQKFNQLEKETYTIHNSEGLKLDAWYVPAAQKTDKTVVVVHGFRQDKTAMRQYGQLFHELGYNVLMPDNQGSGQSEGKFITFGYKDQDDVIDWVNFLNKKNENSKVSLFGISMGASTVMFASGNPRLPASVQNIIQDCGYDNIWTEINYQAKSAYNLPAFPLVYSVSLENKLRQGFFYQDGDVTKSLAKNKTPILMIHGSGDTYVPYSMMKKNYDAVKAGTPKEKLTVKNASHATSFQIDPDLYRQTIKNFMNKYN